jgi:hypothetical protein
MAALNVRVDPQTAALLEQVARRTGRTKSEVVREALEALRDQARQSSAPTPSEAMRHLIG